MNIQIDFMKLQTGMDWVGEQIDNGFDTINRWANDAADAVGEAITGAVDWINPFS